MSAAGSEDGMGCTVVDWAEIVKSWQQECDEHAEQLPPLDMNVRKQARRGAGLGAQSRDAAHGNATGL